MKNLLNYIYQINKLNTKHGKMTKYDLHELQLFWQPGVKG